MTTRAMHAALFTLVAALLAQPARADLDRPPSILEYRQVGDQVRLLWALGGNEDGSLDQALDVYTVERQGLGLTGWTQVFSDDEHPMTYVDSIDDSETWSGHRGNPVEYRVKAGDNTLSASVSLTPSLPVWIEEAQDGKARLAWVASTIPHPSYPVHSGYRVQKLVSGVWTPLNSIFVTGLSWIDLATTTGVSRYRVRDFWKNTNGTAIWTTYSNEVEIQIGAVCEGQATNPAIPPLQVIVIGDLISDSKYDGADIAKALEECAELQYEDLTGSGDHDGECDAGEPCITGGCILRALPKTYDDVSILITNFAGLCNSVSQPEHCLIKDFPAGLVIEGQGHETVFRSPLWASSTLPTPVLEIRRREFPVTLRNLVLDGRKQEQIHSQQGGPSAWHHYGFRAWNHPSVVDIPGDGIGYDDGACVAQTCSEDPAGTHDGDGLCEAGEACLGPGGTPCLNDAWTNAEGCQSTISTDDGCIHNVEVRNFMISGVYLSQAQRWIIEDSEIHDMGCVNRGYGFDCPRLDIPPATPDEPTSGLIGFKTAGYGLDIGWFTSQFKIRRNEVYRIVKYGLSFKNQGATSCTGRLEDHEVSYNGLHDLGWVGIFNHGSVGARVHHNTIDGTTLWNEPADLNPAFNSFGMSLGGYCSDDNQYYYNTMTNLAGIAVFWDASQEMVTCSDPGGCTPVAEQGTLIRNTTIDGTCLEKNADPTLPLAYEYAYGAFQTGGIAAGTLSLIDNTLTNPPEEPGCRSTISAYGQVPSTQPLAIEVTGGSYESGENGSAPTVEAPFYCGAVHVHGSNRKIVLRDDTSIVNTKSSSVAKACIGYDATIVIDDLPTDPFVGLYSEVFQADGTDTTIVYCSASPEDPDCQ